MYAVAPDRAYVFEPVWQDSQAAARARGMIEAIGSPPVTTITDDDIPDIVRENGWIGIPARGKELPPDQSPPFVFNRLRMDESVPIYDLRPRWTTIDLGRTGCVYDTRKGVYIDKTDKVQAVVAPARALLYSILPYAVDRVDVIEQGSTDPRDKDFTISVVPSEGTPGMHVFHVTVIDPSGRERPEYAQNVKAAKGTEPVRVRMALSDPSGFWHLKARDTASGHFGQFRFEYRAP